MSSRQRIILVCLIASAVAAVVKSENVREWLALMTDVQIFWAIIGAAATIVASFLMKSDHGDRINPSNPDDHSRSSSASRSPRESASESDKSQ